MTNCSEVHDGYVRMADDSSVRHAVLDVDSKSQTPRLAPAPAASSQTAPKVMQGNRSDSAVERALRSELHRRGLRFRKHLAGRARSALPTRRRIYARPRCRFFVDGCFWHSCPIHENQAKANAQWWKDKLQGNVDRDRRNDETLRGAGWTVLRVWAHEPITSMADRVVALLAVAQLGRDGSQNTLGRDATM